MKLFYGVIVSLVSIQVMALDLAAIGSSVSQLTSKECKTDLPAPDKSKLVQIGYLRGSPVDLINDEAAGDDYLKMSKSLLEARGFQVKTKGVHHLNYQEMCDEFKKTPDSRVVLVGHSYGGSGALQVAKCLNEAHVNTELVISVSSFDFLKTTSASDIQPYIKNNVNFFIPNSIISGYREHVAVDSSQTHIQNVESEINGLGSAHLFAPRRLMPLLGLVTAAQIEGKSDAVKMGAKLTSDQVNSELAKFWKCEAPPAPVAVAPELAPED